MCWKGRIDSESSFTRAIREKGEKNNRQYEDDSITIFTHE